MRWWDLEAVLSLEGEVFGDRSPWSRETWWAELAGVPETRTYVVVEQGATVAGYAGIAWASWTADVMTVAVAPQEQGRGHGHALVHALLSAAEERGVDEVILEVHAGNVPAIALYRGHGFRLLSRRRDYYGRGEDGLVLRRRLGRPVRRGPTPTPPTEGAT
jgi:ribosomal-protein-alanine N-acetyltransferase